MGGAINLNKERLLGLAIGEGAETFLGRAVYTYQCGNNRARQCASSMHTSVEIYVSH